MGLLGNGIHCHHNEPLHELSSSCSLCNLSGCDTQDVVTASGLPAQAEASTQCAEPTSSCVRHVSPSTRPVSSEFAIFACNLHFSHSCSCSRMRPIALPVLAKTAPVCPLYPLSPNHAINYLRLSCSFSPLDSKLHQVRVKCVLFILYHYCLK